MGEPKETLGEHIARTQAKALDPKLSLETVAEDWGCTVRHILHLEQRGQIRIMRFGRRMCRIPLSEKLRYEKKAANTAPDSAVAERFRLAREEAA